MENFVPLKGEIERILQNHGLTKDKFRLFAFDANSQITTAGILPWKPATGQIRSWLREQVASQDMTIAETELQKHDLSFASLPDLVENDKKGVKERLGKGLSKSDALFVFRIIWEIVRTIVWRLRRENKVSRPEIHWEFTTSTADSSPIDEIRNWLFRRTSS